MNYTDRIRILSGALCCGIIGFGFAIAGTVLQWTTGHFAPTTASWVLIGAGFLMYVVTIIGLVSA